MLSDNKAMVVLLEAEELRLVHRDWPGDMRLAVCLLPDGECQLMLYHKQEAGLISDRLQAQLGRHASNIAVHPPQSGFPTHSLKYSDERALEALLSESADLVEDAHDYSVNFAFAEEQGLDPVVFLGLEVPEIVPSTPIAPVTAALAELAGSQPADESALLFASSRVKPQAATRPLRKLHFDLDWEAARLQDTDDAPRAEQTNQVVREAAKQSLLDAMQAAAQKMNPSGFELRVPENGGIEILSAGQSGAEIVISDLNAVLLRDDRRLLAIDMGGHTETPARIRVLPHATSMQTQTYLTARQGSVSLSTEAGFAYVTLENTPEEARAIAPEPETQTPEPKKKRSKWAGMRLLALTTITTIAIFLVLGSQLGHGVADEVEKSVIDWDQFRLSMNGN